MRTQRADDRQCAIQRYLAGESPTAICASMGYSRVWFFKWWRRCCTGEAEWYHEHSRRPQTSPQRLVAAVEAQVVAVRQQLVREGLFHGAQAILWELEDREVSPLPSVRTIGRILCRHALTRRRDRYIPKGTPYPAPRADRPGLVQQTDFVGPCHLRGPVRFYSLNTVEIATNRCAVEPLAQRGGQHTVDALWASWCRLGMPRHQQVDNEMLFYGSPAHPRGMGMLIRLCLPLGIEPWFIPPAEPWRNGVVEKFNDHWRQQCLHRRPLATLEDVHAVCRRFEARHNSRYRYSKLGGKTPLAALQASGVALRFPHGAEPPQHPLPKPTRGRYHLVRLVRTDRVLDVFTEKFTAPPEAVYEYVRLTIDVTRQRLLVFLDNTLIDEHDYRLR